MEERERERDNVLVFVCVYNLKVGHAQTTPIGTSLSLGQEKCPH